MDTSNRQPTITADWVQFVLGEVKASPNQVSPEKLMELVQIVVNKCRHQLQHFPEFSPIGGMRKRPELQLSQPTFTDDISDQKKCFHIAEVSRIEEKQGKEVVKSSITHLLLDTDGRMIVRKYDDTSGYFTGGHYYYLQKPELLAMLQSQPNLIRLFFQQLRSAISGGIMRRENYLRDMRQLYEYIGDIQANMGDR